jgi:hypothetical protein
MKASEFFKGKARQHKDERLMKIASMLEGSEDDFELMTKVAFLPAGLATGITKLLSNPIMRNAAIGAGTGAAAGAVNARPGERLSGALTGGAVGGAIGGLGTAGKNVYQATSKGAPLGAAIKAQGQSLAKAFKPAPTGNNAGSFKNLANANRPTPPATTEPGTAYKGGLRSKLKSITTPAPAPTTATPTPAAAPPAPAPAPAPATTTGVSYSSTKPLIQKLNAPPHFEGPQSMAQAIGQGINKGRGLIGGLLQRAGTVVTPGR